MVESFFVHEMKCGQCQSVFIIQFGASDKMKYCPRCRCLAKPTGSKTDMLMHLSPVESSLGELANRVDFEAALNGMLARLGDGLEEN